MKKSITILTVILSLMLVLTACGTKAAVAPSGALLLAETVLKGRMQPAARILQEENKTEGQEPLYVDDGTVPGVYRVYSFMGMPLAGFAVVMDTTPEEAANFMVLELREDGTGSIDVQGEHAELTYTVDGDSLTYGSRVYGRNYRAGNGRGISQRRNRCGNLLGLFRHGNET